MTVSMRETICVGKLKFTLSKEFKYAAKIPSTFSTSGYSSLPISEKQWLFLF